MTSTCVTVAVPPRGSVAALLDGRPVEEVFTAAERLRCAERPGLGRAAGLLAAKRAVLAALGAPDGVRWADVEVLPDAVRCPDPARCTASHPPAVRLRGALPDRLAPGESVTVSISHARTVAVALAVRR
ncbi:hypothetical protein [Cryptosporangium aurantiacum]|uniref:Phosphopantetheinyl transferase (Holo-ACP synthase) n=1 Tax=Cryptosporangium aurantiacum TaxID=134849 RepID=A0A1M7QAR8_9ACTN|nr:hypothetical protein [Cryptosporangium aurantiacum]SHN27628.1 Phosphopantetheinyl transferase (holo-ACP synthase) [Cryptosporangium aurantiacum]